MLELCTVLTAYDTGRIGLREVRVYFAAAASVAIREAAGRSRRAKGGSHPELARYRLRELARLSGLCEANVASAARRLARAALVRIAEDEIALIREPSVEGIELAEAVCGRGRSPRRPVPIPRPFLRLLACTERIALTKTLVAYLIRGLSLDRASGEVRGAGSVKLTWIAAQFGLSERAARYARKELITLGILAADPGSSQRKLNRHGAYFVLNLDWSKALHRESTEAVLAPLPARNALRFAPPERDKRTSSGIKDRKTRRERVAGLRGAQGGGRLVPPRPCLQVIRAEDLRRTSRVVELYRQATEVGWLEASEANRTNFVAAAVRATRARGHTVRIFVALVRRGLWHHITGEEEARAVAALKRFNGTRVMPAGPRARGNRIEARLGTAIASALGSLGVRVVS